MIKYIKKEDRKKLLFISDDIKGISGVANIAKNIILETSNVYNWVNLAGLISHPDKGKRIDISEAVNKEMNIEDTSVIQYPVDGYGNPDILREIIKIEKPDGLVFITDPRQYIWLFNMENEIRSQGIKMIYINIWDETGVLPFWNFPYYASCDGLLAISKQTADINTRVIKILDDTLTPNVKYFPHGVSHTKLLPIEENDQKLIDIKKELFGDNNFNFVVFFNARNIRRKSIPDLIMAFKLFLDKLDTLYNNKSKECVLLLHTSPIDSHGTDLYYVTETLLGERKNQVVFDNKICDLERLNLLYNVADVTGLISSNEGFGLSGLESLMSGTPIIVNATGGMQDYCRFVDKEGNWYTNDENVPSNHLETYRECGSWAFPVFPSCLSLQGSIETPAIFDSRCSFFDVSKKIYEVYSLSKDERRKRGLEGREWVCSDEANMTSEKMGLKFVEFTDEILSVENKKSTYKIYKIGERPLKYTKNIFPKLKNVLV